MARRSLLERTAEWLPRWPKAGKRELCPDDSQGEKTGVRWEEPAGPTPYCLVLATDCSAPPDDAAVATAWKMLEKEMAFVPAGETSLVVTLLPAAGAVVNDAAPPLRRVRVRAVYLDRYAVTHEDFAEFVAAGGYRRPEFWPPQLLNQVLQFLDSTGRAGPRYWSNGRPAKEKRKHPVVGVSWYEASAYARWAGKRLPTPGEWQRAACWADGRGSERKYPWGDAFDPQRANTWLAGPGDTLPVTEHHAGSTAHGIYQLVGNVWEWLAAAFDCKPAQEGASVVFDQPMGEVRGGAFDTYFETQATCHFRSGQPLLFRGANVGFRCCVSLDDLRPQPEPSAYLEADRRT